jgi:hypothetical protein
LPTFLKTGDQSGYADIQAAGYRVFLRGDLLGVLRAEREAGVTNAIFIDFLEHLEQLEASVRSYVNLPVAEWTKQWEPWKGFYEQLGQEKSNIGWGYVPNPSGGFLGAWWHDNEWQGCGVYLQVEQGPLCFIADKLQRSNLRDRWHKQLMEATKRVMPLPLKRPRRFGSGATMTVAFVEQSSWLGEMSDGRLDMVATLNNLNLAEKLVDAARLSNPPA